MKTVASMIVVLGLIAGVARAEPRYDDGYVPQRIHAEPLRGASGAGVGHVEQRLSGPSYTNYRKPDAPAAGYSGSYADGVYIDNSRTIIVNDTSRYADRDGGYYRADGATYDAYRARSNVVINSNIGYSTYRSSGWYGGYGVGYAWGSPGFCGYTPVYRQYYRGCYYSRYHGGWYSGWNIGYRAIYGSGSSVRVGVSFGSRGW